MNSNEHFSLNTFTDTTKKACTCSAASIFLIVLFIISPLSSFVITSIFIRVIILLLLAYTIYLNIQQSNYLRQASNLNLSNGIEIRQIIDDHFSSDQKNLPLRTIINSIDDYVK